MPTIRWTACQVLQSMLHFKPKTVVDMEECQGFYMKTGRAKGIFSSLMGKRRKAEERFGWHSMTMAAFIDHKGTQCSPKQGLKDPITVYKSADKFKFRVLTQSFCCPFSYFFNVWKKLGCQVLHLGWLGQSLPASMLPRPISLSCLQTQCLQLTLCSNNNTS